VPSAAAAFDPDASPDAVALLTAQAVDPQAYRGRVATDGACFAAATFPASCTWLDSQARIEDALGTVNILPTEVTACTPLVFYDGKAISGDEAGPVRGTHASRCCSRPSPRRGGMSGQARAAGDGPRRRGRDGAARRAGAGDTRRRERRVRAAAGTAVVPPLTMMGYVDFGFADAGGDGTSFPPGDYRVPADYGVDTFATAVNSRGDVASIDAAGRVTNGFLPRSVNIAGARRSCSTSSTRSCVTRRPTCR
jgi:hypothetical protein